MTTTVTEKEFQATVIEAAELLGWFVYHTHDSRRSHKGFPDLVLAHPRLGLIFAELKTEKGKVTNEQAAWLAVLDTIEAEVMAWTDPRPMLLRVEVWRPWDWPRIERTLGGRA